MKRSVFGLVGPFNHTTRNYLVFSGGKIGLKGNYVVEADAEVLKPDIRYSVRV